MTVFVPAGPFEQGNVATWLLYSADENDIDRRSIKTTRGGFNIPDELAAAIGIVPEVGPVVVAAAPVPEVPASEEPKTPPPGWEDPLPAPDVEFVDGKVYLTEEAQEREAEPAEAEQADREDIRAWAKENGYNPAEKGALKKSVLEAYAAAHGE